MANLLGTRRSSEEHVRASHRGVTERATVAPRPPRSADEEQEQEQEAPEVVPPPAELTTIKKILVAASELDQHQDTFTAEDLIVQAWKSFPESFGLNGYQTNFPDSNRVLSKLMGSVGLCSRGWLELVSTRTYRMTPGGRRVAISLRPAAPRGADRRAPSERKERRAPAVRTPVAALRAEVPAEEPVAAPPPAPVRPVVVAPPAPAPAPKAEPKKAKTATPKEPPPPVVKTPVPYEHAESISTLARTVAAQKFLRGGMITFQDACGFWNLGRNVSGNQIVERLEGVKALLRSAEEHIQQTGAPIRVGDAQDMTLTTVIGLQGLHLMLAKKYQRELSQLAGRK